MNTRRVKISTTVPVEHAEALREALGEAGAGVIGEYTFCSFSVVGKGRFVPGEGTDPHIGEANKLETVTEEKIEVVCKRDAAKRIITALKKAHPYEEVIVDVVPLIDEDQLQ